MNKIVKPLPVSVNGMADCHPDAGHPKLPPGDEMYAVPPLNDWVLPDAVKVKSSNEVTVRVPNGGGVPVPMGQLLVVVCCRNTSVPGPTDRL